MSSIQPDVETKRLTVKARSVALNYCFEIRVDLNNRQLKLVDSHHHDQSSLLVRDATFCQFGLTDHLHGGRQLQSVQPASLQFQAATRLEPEPEHFVLRLIPIL